jgi:putative membrane protein
MEPALNSLAAGFPWLIFFLLLATALYIIGIIVYVQLTPHKEILLIRQGNMSAAVSFSGFLVALVLPLAACLTSSVSLFDLAVWGTVSLLLQLFLFRMTDILLPDLPKRITQDDMAAATVLTAFKLAGSILLASAIFVKF